MSNGREWTEADTRTLRRLAGSMSDASIGRITGHCERTVRDRRGVLHIPAFHPKRTGWSRRDYLLADAAWQNA